MLDALPKTKLLSQAFPEVDRPAYFIWGNPARVPNKLLRTWRPLRDAHFELEADAADRYNRLDTSYGSSRSTSAGPMARLLGSLLVFRSTARRSVTPEPAPREPTLFTVSRETDDPDHLGRALRRGA